MSGISTHVLDTSSGKPAADVRIRLYRDDDEINSAFTNGDGRCPALLPKDRPLTTGTYRIVLEIAGRFPESFYPEIVIAFSVRDASAHYHVPVLISPFGFTTYRGS